MYRVKRHKDSAPEVLYPCPKCKVPYISPLEHAGRADKCMICGAEVVVPGKAELAEYVREQALLPPAPPPPPEPATLLDKMGKKFIDEVRDQVLSEHRSLFFPHTPPRADNPLFSSLIAKLDESEKDVAWKLLTRAVEQTIDRTIRFVEHKRVTGEMRVTLTDPATHEEIVLTDGDQDVPTLFWFEWIEKYAKLTRRPTTHRQVIREDWGETSPQAVLDAVARDFPGTVAVPVYRELTSGADAPTAYVVRIGDDNESVTYAPDGTRR